jgi:basic membrane lipoprotein Med (substrate-binding protein (PBP1-ABC) superfamily)
MKFRTFTIIVTLFAALLTLTVLPFAAQDDVFRVAAVAPSATNDLAFSQSMYDALTIIQEEMGEDAFEFEFLDGTFIVDDAAVALREWAASGDYDLIIAHGSQYGSILEELAPEFPDISFAWGTDTNTFGLDNVYAYSADSDEGGYVNGVLAAALTETNVVGVVGPIEVGDAKLYVDGFVYAIEQTNPDATVNVVYIESFSDVPAATEAAEAHIANGADILTGTAQMVVGPIGVVLNEELLWFGTQSSQAELSETTGVTFQIYRWDTVLRDIMSNIDEGILGGQSYTLTLENGGLEIEINEAYEMSDELMLLAEETIQGIIDGEISTLPMDEEMMDEEEVEDPEATEEAG